MKYDFDKLWGHFVNGETAQFRAMLNEWSAAEGRDSPSSADSVGVFSHEGQSASQRRNEQLDTWRAKWEHERFERTQAARRREFIDRAAIALLSHAAGEELVSERINRKLRAQSAYAAATALWSERERLIEEGKL